MVAVSHPTKYLAAEVLFYALVDLIHQRTQVVVGQPDYDGAAEFFRSGDYEPWCVLAEVDSDAVLSYAIKIAIQYKLWVEHPHIYKRPRIEIKSERWRTINPK